MNKKYILGIVLLSIFILISFNVVAVPPVQTTFTADQDGLQIEHLRDDNIQINEPLEWHFHVYNQSNGVIMTNASGISCNGDMYNKKGMGVLSLFAEPKGNDWFFNASAGNFSQAGLFSYQVFCNDSVKGGYLSGTIMVSPTGEEMTESDVLIAFAVIFSSVALSFLFAWFGFKFSESEKTFIFSLFFMLMSLVAIIYMLFTSYVFVRDILFNVSILNAQFNLWYVVMLSLIGVAMIGLANLTVKTLKHIKVSKSLYKNTDNFNNPTNNDLYGKR